MTYRATEDIFVAAGVRAYRKGQIVPDSAVKNLKVQDKVESDRPAPAPRPTPSPRPAPEA